MVPQQDPQATLSPQTPALKPTAPRLIGLVFILYAFLLVPFGLPSEPHPGYYSVEQIDPGDDAGYFAYVRSAVIDGDLDFFNERGFWHFDAVVDTGYTANYWYIGAPLLWLPFFLAGHAAALLLSLTDAGLSPDGYGYPYKVLTFAGSALATLAGLLLGYRCLRRLYSERTAAWAAVLMLTATCLPYFTFIRNRMSHPGDVLAAFGCLYLYLMAREQPRRSPVFFFGWGLLLGWLVDLRYISIVYALLPLGWILQHARRRKDSSSPALSLTGPLLCGLAGLLIGALPQWTFWLRVHGVFSSLNPITVQVEPTVPGVLASFLYMFTNGTRGLLRLEVLWVPALAGLLITAQRDRWLAALLALVFLGFSAAPVVIVDPATFGQRYLLPALPVFAVGLGALLQKLEDRGRSRWMILPALSASFWIYWTLLHYKTVFPHNDPQFLKQAWQALLTGGRGAGWVRPTTLPDLWLTGRWTLLTPRDWTVLIGLPLLLMAGTGLLVRGFSSPGPSAKPAAGRALLSGPRAAGVTAGFCLLVSGWILFRHPPLPPETTAERMRTAAVSRFLKAPGRLDEPLHFLERADHHAPSPAGREIRGDIDFLQGRWEAAAARYREAAPAVEDSPVWAQLDRLARLTGTAPPSDPRDPTAALRAEGWFLLDVRKQPEAAVERFQQALAQDPRSRYAPGLRRLIAQWARQRARMQQARRPVQTLPPVFLQLLGTRVNEVRLTLPLFAGAY